MTPPQPVAPVAKATPPAPEESPEIKATRNAVQQAGNARNRAELAYQQAVKEHGADSDAAKAAKDALGKAQTEVESLQGALRKLLNLPTGGAPTAKNETKKVTPPAPQKVAVQAPKPSETPPKAIFREFREELLIHREIRGEMLIREIHFDEAKLRKILDEIKKDPKIFERIQRNHGEFAKIRLSVLRAAPKDD